VGRGLKIHTGLDRDGVGKGNVATLKAEFRAVESGLALQDVGPAQHYRAGCRAAQTQVGIAGKTSDSRFHLQLRSGLDVYVELDSIQWRIGRRNGRKLAAALQVSAEIESRCDRQLGDGNVARQS